MSDVSELKDFDNFFYYGQGDLSRETRHDVLLTLLQPGRSLYYSRDLDSAGIDGFENSPNTIGLTVLIPYNVVKALAKRNQFVGNGDGGTVDRRVAVSQNTVRVRSNKNVGELNVTVQYVPLANLNEGTEVSAPLGIGA